MSNRTGRPKTARRSTTAPQLPKLLEYVAEHNLSPFLRLAAKYITAEDEKASVKDERIPEPIRGAALKSRELRLILGALRTFDATFLSTLNIPRSPEADYLLESQYLGSRMCQVFQIYKAIPSFEAAIKQGNPQSAALKKIVREKETVFAATIHFRDEYLRFLKAKESTSRRSPHRQPRDVRYLAFYIWLALQTIGGLKPTHASEAVDELFREAPLLTVVNEKGIEKRPVWPSSAAWRRNREFFYGSPGERTGGIMHSMKKEAAKAIRIS